MKENLLAPTDDKRASWQASMVYDPAPGGLQTGAPKTAATFASTMATVEESRPQPSVGSSSVPLRQIDPLPGRRGWPVLRSRPDGFRRLAGMEQVGTVRDAFDPGPGNHYFRALVTYDERLRWRWRRAAQGVSRVDLHADPMRFTVDAIAGPRICPGRWQADRSGELGAPSTTA